MRQPVPTDNRARFLSLVFRGAGAGFIEFRALPSKARTFVRPEKLDHTAAFVAAHDHEDIYFGVASRRDASSGRLENCESLGAMFADIDFKLLGERDAREQIARFTLPPTIVVASGGGLHVYWTLTVPIDLRSEVARARGLLRRLAHAVGADVSAAEPARVLRVPDTMNFKYQPARPVRIETFEPRRHYRVSEFDRALPAETLTPTAGIDVPTDGEHICEGQRNVMLYSIARSLRARRLTYEAIAGVVQTVNSKLCVPPLDTSEVKAIIAKVGRLRLYSGNTPPYFFEVPFRGPVTGPVNRSRAGETLVLDRGRFTADSHYVSPPDDPLLSPLPFSCNFRLANTEPNFSKIITLISPPGGVSFKNIGGRAWISTKGTTQIFNSDPLGQVLATTPRFSDAEKHCVNVEILWTDPQGIQNRGFKWSEVYFPPDRQVTEGVDVVTVDLSGEIYGAISAITSFTSGTES